MNTNTREKTLVNAPKRPHQINVAHKSGGLRLDSGRTARKIQTYSTRPKMT